MGFLNWGRKASIPDQIYSVMNDDHVTLYRIFAELRDAVAVQTKGETERGFREITLLGIIRKLIDKVRDHFGREEALMDKYSYPEARAHRSEHLMLLRSIETYHANLISGARPITDEVVKYLKAWLTNHIRTADRRLDRFLVSAARKTAPLTRGDLGQGGEAGWTAENTLLLATLQDTVPKGTVSEHRGQSIDTIQVMQVRQQRERDRQLKESGRRKAATVARQVRAVFFE